jgi:hypothetical protein
MLFKYRSIIKRKKYAIIYKEKEKKKKSFLNINLEFLSKKYFDRYSNNKIE